jgi:hypothetical protein
MSDVKTEVKIAYEIRNINQEQYHISATLMNSINKVFETISKEIDVVDFNNYIDYTTEEKEIIALANDIVKKKLANVIAKLLEKEINETVEKIKSTLD